MTSRFFFKKISNSDVLGFMILKISYICIIHYSLQNLLFWQFTYILPVDPYNSPVI